MAIFVDENTRLVVQGITGRDGSFHTRQMMEYGTQVVAGVTPGKGGQFFEGPDGKKVPIFNTVEDAVNEAGANTSAIYVPPAFASGAVLEAAGAGISFIVCITEGRAGSGHDPGPEVREGQGGPAARARTARGSSLPGRPRWGSCRPRS